MQSSLNSPGQSIVTMDTTYSHYRLNSSTDNKA